MPFSFLVGYLRADVTMVEAGVYPYMSADGSIVMEAKLPEEIFDSVTISTADGLIVTTNHPPRNDNNGLIKLDNFKKYIHGVVSSPRRVGNSLVGTETIFDAELIQNVSVGDLLV